MPPLPEDATIEQGMPLPTPATASRAATRTSTRRVSSNRQTVAALQAQLAEVRQSWQYERSQAAYLASAVANLQCELGDERQRLFDMQRALAKLREEAKAHEACTLDAFKLAEQLRQPALRWRFSMDEVMMARQATETAERESLAIRTELQEARVVLAVDT
mmetsp:Transcript_9133/g.17212  ORF Transcript_9133/g.17212 Transcript_9133/m.17212 type:complete len:161 (-) Transcript_9133:27-509(-)